MMKNKSGNPRSVADWLDKAFGRIVVAGAVVGYFIVADATGGRNGVGTPGECRCSRMMDIWI
jgi:hypothetical protein